MSSVFGLDSFKNNIEILNLVYPIGSIYMSTNNVSPSTFIGGTWEALDEGRVLIGAGASYPAGSVGGEETHTLTADETPSHNHTRGTMNITGYSDKFDSNSGWDSNLEVNGAFYVSDLGSRGKVTNDSSGSYDWVRFGFDASRSWTGSTSTVGSDQPHNNMQPYLSVYMWKRTA